MTHFWKTKVFEEGNSIRKSQLKMIDILVYEKHFAIRGRTYKDWYLFVLPIFVKTM